LRRRFTWLPDDTADEAESPFDRVVLHGFATVLEAMGGRPRLVRALRERPSTGLVDLQNEWPQLQQDVRDAPARVPALQDRRIDEESWRVLCFWPDPRKRTDVAAWLRGDQLSEDVLQGIGVSAPVDEERAF